MLLEHDFAGRSSRIARALWADEGPVPGLRLVFANGDVYLYPDAPFAKFEGLREADSPGGYFNREILGRYEAVKMSLGTSFPPRSDDDYLLVAKPDGTFAPRIMSLVEHKGRLIVATERAVYRLGDDDVLRPLKFAEE